jgi:hypothetical protein
VQAQSKSKWRSFFERVVKQLGCMTAELAAQRAQRGLPQNCAPLLGSQSLSLLWQAFASHAAAFE